MDDADLKKELIRLGMKSMDADLLIKSAHAQKTSVSKQFLKTVRGLYMGLFFLVATYFIFISGMNLTEFYIFTFIYLSVMAILFLFTPAFKLFFWSIKILRFLKGA